MAKGQMRQTKEKKKPKAEGKAKHVSSYKASLSSGRPVGERPPRAER